MHAVFRFLVIVLLFDGLSVVIPMNSAEASGRHRVAAIVQPLQQFFYFVGQPVRVEALVEKQKRDDIDYQAFLEFKQFQQRWRREQTDQTAAATASSESSTLNHKCGRCHSGSAPRGGLFLDRAHLLRPDQITKAQRRVLDGSMPPSPASPLSAEEIGDVVQELLELEGDQK